MGDMIERLRQTIRQAIEAAFGSIRTLTAERDTLRQSLTAMTTERDALKQSLDASIAERNALTQSLTAMTAERDALKAAAISAEDLTAINNLLAEAQSALGTLSSMPPAGAQ